MAVRISGDEFESKVLNAENPILVEFYSDSCMMCKMVSPVLAEVEEAYAGRLEVYKVNAVYDSELAERYHVLSVPAFVLFVHGEVKKQANGAIKKEELDQWIEEDGELC